jgi:hypothetical protein
MRSDVRNNIVKVASGPPIEGYFFRASASTSTR